MRRLGAGRRGLPLVGLLLVMRLGAPANAWGCILDVGLNGGSPSLTYLFPNWVRTEVVDFDTIWCPSGTCAPDATIRGLTIVNYGTAVGGAGGDIANVYVCFGCSRSSGGACAPTTTLTYAGVWGGQPSWTWAGSLALNADPCNGGPGGCACVFVMRVFVDITACPANLSTVRLGPGFDDTVNPAWPGGVTDATGCAAPWSSIADPNEKTIVYAVKIGDKATVAPGDTVTYTVYYGRPGTVNLTSVTVVDTQPPYTHYLPGSGAPAPDPLWDPDWGPPIRLKWTILPPHPVAGGATAQVVFKLTVDWGNGETFEPGSGDVAAPEGARLDNLAQVTFDGTTCATKAVVTAPITTSVQRFLFWKLGDNDILFSPSYGQPADEMTYEIFVKNMSTTKTWWDVRIWDTVPPQLDPWGTGYGFDDPCLGWTMTPGGCAAATPGTLTGGGATLLTWRLDMPPGMTLTLRWKAAVGPTVTAGATAINKAAILEYGRANIVDGTGHSGVPRRFNHVAPIVLPTTYISYVAMAADACKGGPGFFIDFFPLNKKTQFELRGLQYAGAGWSTAGGVSASIGCLIGDCLGGFPGNGGACPTAGIPGGGIAGCKVERIPAQYEPVTWLTACPTTPFNFIYKLTSNSPVLWQCMTNIDDDNQDNHTYAPSSSLSYTGLMHYMWRRSSVTQAAGFGDSLSLINTGMDAYGIFTAALSTTVHFFRFNYGSLQWDYVQTVELAAESQMLDMGTLNAEEGPWRTVSSEGKLIVNQANNTSNTLGCCCGQCADNYGAFMPTRESGNVVSTVGTAHFYGLVQGFAATEKVVIGNTGAANASYRVWKYVPDNTIAVAPMPANLNGTSGSWVPIDVGTVGAGIANATNPQWYGATFNSSSISLYKVEQLSGGPIQVLSGVAVYSVFAGGAIIHAANGGQTGTMFWLHQVIGQNGCKGTMTDTMAVNVFCPKTGMVIRETEEGGATLNYTTTGPDQCIGYVQFPEPAAGAKYNYTYQVVPGPSSGNVVTMYSQCNFTEKGYTAPFLQTGVHYAIIAPPVVFSGQSFWITVVVVDSGGGTKTDYCGTTSFTATDPLAKLEGVGMDTYNYTWASSIAGCNGGAAINGVRLFFNVTLTRLGLQTVIASDTTDGSITGLTAIMVVGADVKLIKSPSLTLAASGDTVTFRVCWSNFSSASAFTFVISDAVPRGTTFVPEASSAAFNCGNTDGVVPIAAYSTTASVTPPAAFTEANPVAGALWLRWTIPMSGVGTTGCICYRVTVN